MANSTFIPLHTFVWQMILKLANVSLITTLELNFPFFEQFQIRGHVMTKMGLLKYEKSRPLPLS